MNLQSLFTTKLLKSLSFHSLMKEYARYVFRKEGVLPIHLILEATSVCNSRCVTCFNWQKTDSATEKKIELPELEKLSKSLGHLLWFSLTGGEVFLRKDLAELVKIFVDNNKPQHISIPTNALLPEQIAAETEKILKIYKGNLVIVLSLDGIGEAHDKIRGVPGNFNKFLETYNKLSEQRKSYKNLHIGVNTVVNNLNKSEVKKIYNYVKANLKVESHTFELLRGCSRDKAVRSPDIDYYREHKEFFKEVMKRYSYYTFNPLSLFLKAAKQYYHDLAFDMTEQKKMLHPCYAGRLSAVIDCEANVYPCELYKKMGNLKDFDFDFKKLWFSADAEKVRKEIAERKCWCAHSCFWFVNILFNPRLYPAMARYFI